jgi:NADH-quinone oxidoreductase subunit L
MWMLEHMWLIPALPLAGAAVNGLFGRYWPNKRVSAVAVGSTGLSLLFALELFREFSLLAAEQIPYSVAYFPWIVAGNFRADFALYLDQLSMVMVLVVNGVGWLIHVYSTGYMAHEGGYYRFFSYLNLFMFFMLVLVMAGNYALLFVGWEGVGLCSYLLIGFYFLRKSAADAGKKAFVVNRIGDFGFMLGMFLLFRQFDTLDFASVLPAAAKLQPEGMWEFGAITVIALLLLAGATGKSAQVPLYVWLPDAMEGPTPVSALIHAATMVTAGVYVVARSNILYSLSPTALWAVAVVGCITALFAATIGLVQTDIKRVLAYSTVSQLGYMFLACGVGAFAAGIFHLMTHAFFKALLFLGSGSVIHALGGEQDLRKMGGLRKFIPVTFVTMSVGTLAIAGAPFLSGFFSKDAILAAAASSPFGSKWFYSLGLFTALLTAFYMFRLAFLTFFGAPRFDEHAVHVHESPRSMTAPLVALAVLSVIGGWQALPLFFGGHDQFESYMAPVFARSEELREAAAQVSGVHTVHSTGQVWMFAGVATLAALIGVLVSWWLYVRRPETPDIVAERFRTPYRLLLNKYFVDELYDAVVVRPIRWLSTAFFWKLVDVRVIDGAVNGLADAARAGGERLRVLQSGNTRSYAAWVVAGAALVTTFLLWWVQ